MPASLPDEHDDEPIIGPAAQARLQDLRFVGELTQVDANARDCRLVATSHGADSGSDHIDLTALVGDEGRIVDVRYRTLATGGDLVLTDLLAESCLGRTPDEAAKLTPGDIKARLIEAGDERLPEYHIADDRPFPVLVKLATVAGGGEPESTPVKPAGGATASQLPWEEIGLFERVRRIEEVLDEQVRPMLATDGGGIELVDLRDNDLMVQYNGACGSCSSSIGGTMVFIEDTLNGALGVELRLVVQGMDEPEPFLDL